MITFDFVLLNKENTSNCRHEISKSAFGFRVFFLVKCNYSMWRVPSRTAFQMVQTFCAWNEMRTQISIISSQFITEAYLWNWASPSNGNNSITSFHILCKLFECAWIVGQKKTRKKEKKRHMKKPWTWNSSNSEPLSKHMLQLFKLKSLLFTNIQCLLLTVARARCNR